MNAFLAGYIILFTALVNGQERTVLTQERSSETQEVAKDFNYPEARETIKADAPYAVKSLAGTVIDNAGAGMEKVLVERLRSGWGKRLDATFTDSDGCFSFAGSSKKTQYLKLSKPGFDTLLIRVPISKRSKATLKLLLNPST